MRYSGTKCDVGGPLLHKGKQVHAPVPGRCRNCPLCRFFVTGPPFLAWLVAKFNAMAGQITEALARLQEAEAKRRGLAGQAIPWSSGGSASRATRA